MTQTEEIQKFERKFRGVYLTYVIGFLVFAAGWLVRFTIKTIGTLPDWLDYVFTAVLILTLPVQIYAMLRMNALKKRALTDADLSAMFTDELVQAHEKAAWKYGFIAMVIALGIISVFVDVKDTNAVIFTALWAGFGGYHLSFSLLEKN